MSLSNDGHMTILFERATIMTLTPHMAMLLGMKNEPLVRNIENYNDESVTIEIGTKPNSNGNYTGGIYTSSVPINFNFNLKQKFMFIEMNAIKNVAIGNGNGKILKIIPLSLESFGQYVTTDFENLDYHELAYHELHNIEFKLLSQSGSTMEMHEERDYNITWLQLIFKKIDEKEEGDPPLKRQKF